MTKLEFLESLSPYPKTLKNYPYEEIIYHLEIKPQEKKSAIKPKISSKTKFKATET